MLNSDPTDPLLSLNEAAALLGRDRISHNLWWRWHRVGIRNRSTGRRVLLKVLRIGGRLAIRDNGAKGAPVLQGTSPKRSTRFG